MSKPIANFIVQTNGREISFLDISLNHPTTWLWRFGDGMFSREQNPTHTFENDGFYTITLRAFNHDGLGTVVRQIGVSQYGVMLNQSILEIVQSLIPITLTIPISTIQTLIQKWQLFFYPLVTPAVESINIYNEFAYPALVNQLIAYLVIYDLIINGANSYLLGLSQGTSGSGVQEVKKITTGPSDVEWFAGSKTWMDIFTEGGLFDNIKAQLCSIAASLNIWLYMCPKPGLPTKPPQVYYGSKPHFKHHHRR